MTVVVMIKRMVSMKKIVVILMIKRGRKEETSTSQ